MLLLCAGMTVRDTDKVAFGEALGRLFKVKAPAEEIGAAFVQAVCRQYGNGVKIREASRVIPDADYRPIEGFIDLEGKPWAWIEA